MAGDSEPADCGQVRQDRLELGPAHLAGRRKSVEADQMAATSERALTRHDGCDAVRGGLWVPRSGKDGTPKVLEAPSSGSPWNCWSRTSAVGRHGEVVRRRS